jgi:hypothetical protein
METAASSLKKTENRLGLPTTKGSAGFPNGAEWERMVREAGEWTSVVKRRAGPAGRRPARPLFATPGISAEPTRRVLGKITRV